MTKPKKWHAHFKPMQHRYGPVSVFLPFASLPFHQTTIARGACVDNIDAIVDWIRYDGGYAGRCREFLNLTGG